MDHGDHDSASKSAVALDHVAVFLTKACFDHANVLGELGSHLSRVMQVIIRGVLLEAFQEILNANIVCSPRGCIIHAENHERPREPRVGGDDDQGV